MRSQLLRTLWLLAIVSVCSFQTSFAQKRKQVVSDVSSTENKEADVEAQRLLIDGMKAYFIEDYKKAIELFKKIEPSLIQSSSTSLFMIAKCYSAMDSSKQAVLFFEQSIENNPENQYGYRELAKEYEKLGNLSGAQSMLEKVLSFSPQNVESLEKLIELTSNQGKWEMALVFVESLERSGGISEELAKKKQRILLQMNKVEEVLKGNDMSSGTEKPNEDFELKKVQVFMEQKKWTEVEKILVGLLQKKPFNADYLAQLATSKYRQGLKEECLQICIRSIANEEVRLEPFVTILHQVLDEKQVSMDNAHLLLNSINNRAKDELNLSGISVLVKLNRFVQRWQETEKWSSKLIQLDETSFDGWDNLIEANYQLKQIDELIKNAENATSLFPSQSLFWLRLAQGFVVKEDWQNAIEAAEIAVDIPSSQTKNQAESALLLGDCLVKLNQKEKAIRVWKNALSLEFEKEKFLNRIDQHQN